MLILLNFVIQRRPMLQNVGHRGGPDIHRAFVPISILCTLLAVQKEEPSSAAEYEALSSMTWLGSALVGEDTARPCICMK